MTADSHVHFFSHRFFQLLSAAPDRLSSLGFEMPPEDPLEFAARWVAELDANRVERAALIASHPSDVSSVVTAKRACPGRFTAFAMVPPFSGFLPDDIDCACLFPAMHGYSLHDERVKPVFEKYNRIFVHCGVLSVGIRGKLGLPSPFDMRFSNPIELHAIALRYPKTKFIVPHFGAGYFREALMLCDLCANVYLDTSSSNAWMKYEDLDLETVFRRALNVCGPERLLFGSDSSFFPRGWNKSIYETQHNVLKLEIGLNQVHLERIFGGNFAELFPQP